MLARAIRRPIVDRATSIEQSALALPGALGPRLVPRMRFAHVRRGDDACGARSILQAASSHGNDASCERMSFTPNVIPAPLASEACERD